MTVRLGDYIPLEEGIASYLYGLWEAEVRPLMPKLVKAVEGGDYDAAIRLLRGVDVQSIALEAKPAIENGVLAHLTFGAMLSSGSNKVIYHEERLPPVTEPVYQSYVRALQDIQTRALEGIQRVISATEPLQKSDSALEEAPCYHHTSPVLELLKSEVMTIAQKLNAVVMGQAKSAIDVAANLNTSRLVGLGFLQQHQARGYDVYQISAQLDGRVCPVCHTMHGKTFSVQSSMNRLMRLLTVADPLALKAMAPFPSQSKANITELRAMTPAKLQASGLDTPPYHPGCRCRQVKVGTVPAKQILPVGPIEEAVLPDVPAPPAAAVTELASKQLSPKMLGAKDALSQQLTDKQIEVLDKIFDSDTVINWARICSGKPLVQKGEASFSFCSAFNPKKMKELVSQADKAVKAWELDSEAKLWRIATGEFASELLEAIGAKTIKGAVIHDKGFTIWSDKFIPQDGPWVKVHLTAPKGAKAVKVGDQYAFPTSTKLHVYDTKVGKDGVHTVYVKVLEEVDDELPSLSEVADQLEIKTPKVVPAGTAAREAAKRTLGDDYLDATQLMPAGAKPGGSVPGYMGIDKDGTKWIVKTVKNEEIARNEVLSAKLYQAAGVEVPDIRLARGPNGEVWVASKFEPGFTTDMTKLLGVEHLPGQYDGFVVDAWLSNWDVVGLDFDNIGLLNGRAVRIDVGGALRFRAQGSLKSEAMFSEIVDDLDSLRNPSINPQAASVFADIREAELRAGAAKVLGVSNDLIKELVQKYGPVDQGQKNLLSAKLIARKQDIAKRFPDATKPVAANPIVEPKGKLEPNAFATDQEWKMVRDARINGYAFKTDFDQIEGQNVLVWIEETADGRPQTVAQFKLRGDKLYELERMAASAEANPDLGDLHDKYYSAMTAYNNVYSRIQQRLNGLASNEGFDSIMQGFVNDAKSRLSELSKTLRDLEFRGQIADKPAFDRAMAFVTKLQERVAKAPMTGEPSMELTSWTRATVPEQSQLVPMLKKPDNNAAIRFDKIERTWSKKTLTDGFAVDQGEAQWGQQFKAYLYEKEGARVELVPTDEHKAALRGRVTITVEGHQVAASARIKEMMEELGIASHRASELEQEFLYLLEMAYIKPETWNKVASFGGFNDQLPLPRRVSNLRDLIKKDFNATDADIDRHRYGQRQAFEQGNSVNLRLDMQGQEWEDFAKTFRLTHDNTGDSDLADLMDKIMAGGGRMITTVDKERRGIPTGGMSPDSDLNTGGADYFFTRVASMERIASKQRTGQFVFKADSIRRTTTISYFDDVYGQTDTTDFIHRNRITSLDQLKGLDDYGSNETIVKNGLSLFDDLDFVIVSNADEKQRIIEVMHRHKLKQWPDGRKLEEVFVLRHEIPGAPLPVWVPKEFEAEYKAMAAEGATNWEMKQKIMQLKDQAAAKASTVKIPAWAEDYPDEYKIDKNNGLDDWTIANKYKQYGMYKEAKVTTGAVVDPTDLDAKLPTGQPMWAYGYSKYYTKWVTQGLSEAEVKKKVLAYAKDKWVYPDWLPGFGASKTMYKQLKELGHPDLVIQQKMADQGLAPQPGFKVATAKVSSTPSWADGYESYYTEFKSAGLNMSDITDQIAAYEADPYVYPSWLKEDFKTWYSELKLDGMSDFDLKNKHPEWVE